MGDKSNIKLVEEEWTTQPAKTQTGLAQDKLRGISQINITKLPHNSSQIMRNNNKAKQCDTPSLQELVSNMCESKRQTEQPPKATQQTSNHRARLQLDDSNVHPIHTAIDIQSGLIMAIKEDALRLRCHTTTALPR